MYDESEPITVSVGHRHVAFDVSGKPTGWPVFLLHGMPGSRRGPRPRSGVLYRLGVNLISYDRAGYGGSTRHSGRTVADAAEDVAAIANVLGIDRFAVVGRSGGGPHALACAALMPDRVSRTLVLVSVAPRDAVGLTWSQGMNNGNVQAYGTADADLSACADEIRQRAVRVSRDPSSMLEELLHEMTEPDRRVVSDPGLRRLLADTYAEALRHGADGWVDDMAALRSDWGFELDAVKGPVRFWHGADDNFSPASHTRWLASRIPQAEVQVELGAAHFGAFPALLGMFSWLTTPEPA